MPDGTLKTKSNAATLEFEGGVRLGGDLSPLSGGGLLLESVRLLSGPVRDGRLSLKPGTVAKLVTPAGSGYPDDVVIADATENTITLRPADAASVHRGTDAARGAHQSSVPTMGATAEYSAALDVLRQKSLLLLEQMLKPFLRDLGDHLLDLSVERRDKSSSENSYYEALSHLRRESKAILRQILHDVEAAYGELTPPGGGHSEWGGHIKSFEELDIVDFGEFEGSLAVDRMITRGEEMYGRAMEMLVIRLATLIDADPLKVRLPVHVQHLCRVIQHALGDQNFPADVVPPVLQFFSLDLIGKLGPYYEELNREMAERGICPELEREIAGKGSLLKRRKSRSPAPQKPDEPKKAPSQSPRRPEEEKTDRVEIGARHLPALEGFLASLDQNSGEGTVYRSIVDAMNFSREAEGLAPADSEGQPLAGTWEGRTVRATDVDQDNLADARDIARALGTIQRDSRVRADVQQSSSLREYLASNRDRLGQLNDTSGLTAESLNQLDLVDNLFGTIKSQLDVTAELKPALGNLQIPLAKLALLDPRFFLDRGHAARNVVDKLSHLAASGNFPNKALENRIGEVVDEIVDDYETDSSVFDTALKKLERLSAQQERAMARNVERVVRTQKGQEKLRKAQQAVKRTLEEKLSPPAAPRVLIDLVDNGWRDLLVLTHVKEGPQSSTWKEHIKTLDLLTLWLTEQQSGDVEEDLVMQRGLEAEPLIDMIEQEIAAALPTQVSHQPVLSELREILAGEREVELVDVEGRLPEAAPSTEKVRAKIEDLPRLRRWVKRVEQLQPDSWLTYKGKDGKKQRMRLAWISQDRDRYIFVNERGQKVAEFSHIQLARQLSRGVQPPSPADKLSVVDQSLYQTLEHAQKTLSFARNHDSLTKLINRDMFLDQMRRARRHAQLKSAQHAVLFIDIDQFTLVNEVYDRVTGDQVLLEFARLLAQLHGKKSSSARLEGDQFAVLLLDRPMEQALKVADKIRQDIAAGSVEIDGEKVSFTVSIGAVPILEHSPPVEQLLDSARAAMRSAKEQGRNCVTPFEGDHGDLGQFKEEKTRTRRDLEQALATERFVLRAQPIMQTSVRDGESVSLHYELLLGLSNTDGSISSPEEFIQSAERYGFMTLVDRWVVKEAFSWISQLMDAQKVVPNLAINLSGTSVTEDSFMDFLLEQISEFGVGTSRICFEITETGTISNLVKAADFVRTFRNIGCKFSIDDFGTGLASHNYLRELPVDYVKIDGTFVREIHKNRSDYAMARSINDLAHFLGQETIAESVENDEIVAKLREISVDYLQGWGIARPRLLDDIAEDLSSIDK